MFKYSVGDIVSTHFGEMVIAVQNQRAKIYHYGAKEIGTDGNPKSTLYRLANHQILEKVGEMDLSEDNKGQEYAMKKAEEHDGTPEGDRWLVLATTAIGDSISITTAKGKVVEATLLEIKPKGLK